MLPEELSTDLCSLKEGEDRPCLAVRMVFDADGHKHSHRFLRGVMRSAARLTYEQAQAAFDGKPDDATGPLLEPVLRPIYGPPIKRSPLAREQRATRWISICRSGASCWAPTARSPSHRHPRASKSIG